jgi:hypothetical protein
MLAFFLMSLFLFLAPIQTEENAGKILKGLKTSAETIATRHGKVKDASQRSYLPYTSDPYDVGPTGLCSRPQLDICNFPDDYTVPEYVARTVVQFNDVLKELDGDVRNLDGSRCAKALTDFMCRELISPQCISDTTVRYPANSSAVCQTAMANCPRFALVFPAYCDVVSRGQPSGDFSLTECRVPSVTGCGNTRPSPDWIVAQFEHTASSVSSLEDAAQQANMYGDCIESYMRLSCTKPTCEDNGRLLDYRSSAQCHDVVQCVPDPDEQMSVAKSLQCQHVDKLRFPSSPAAGAADKVSQPTSTSSTNSDYATFKMGIALASILFVLLFFLA